MEGNNTDAEIAHYESRMRRRGSQWQESLAGLAAEPANEQDGADGSDAFPLQMLTYHDLELLHEGVTSEWTGHPLFLFLGFTSKPIIGHPEEMVFELRHSARHSTQRLTEITVQTVPLKKLRTFDGLADREIAKLPDIPGFPDHSIYVIAADHKAEQAFTLEVLQDIATQCVMAGEWRPMHVLEWEFARNAARDRGLKPETQVPEPNGFWWRLIRPILPENDSGSMHLEWVLLYVSNDQFAQPRTVARVVTLADGTLVSRQESAVAAKLGLFEAAPDVKATCAA